MIKKDCHVGLAASSQRRNVLLLLLSIFSFSAFAQRIPIETNQLNFKLQSYLDESNLYPCQHQVMFEPYDWDVYCKVDSKIRHFTVHLALDRYPQTNFGKSAYELLYWVSDITHDPKLKRYSTTLWIHQDKEGVMPKLVQAAQGVDNDDFALKLSLQIP